MKAAISVIVTGTLWFLTFEIGVLCVGLANIFPSQPSPFWLVWMVGMIAAICTWHSIKFVREAIEEWRFRRI